MTTEDDDDSTEEEEEEADPAVDEEEEEDGVTINSSISILAWIRGNNIMINDFVPKIYVYNIIYDIQV
jgi:hypothetical protein